MAKSKNSEMTVGQATAGCSAAFFEILLLTCVWFLAYNLLSSTEQPMYVWVVYWLSFPIKMFHIFLKHFFK